MWNWYFKTWWQIIAQPIYFYTFLKEEDWKENSLTFLLISSWLLALFLTMAIFLIQYLPIGSTLVEGITGLKFLLILPVLLTLAFVFFTITFLILGGVLSVGLGGAFYLVGFLLHYLYIALGGKGHLNRMLQNCFYSSAVVLAGFFPALFAVLTRYKLLDFSLFRVGFNFFFFLAEVYVYGLWAVAGRKTYKVSKAKAFLGALLPAIFLLIFCWLFDKMAIPKFEPWITPLK